MTTPILAVAGNSYRNWNVVLTTTVVVDSSASAQYLAGTPTGYIEAPNTLSLTAITIPDAQGQPLTASGLTSYAGFDYSAGSSASAPEPGTAWFVVSLCSGYVGKRRANFRELKPKA